MDNNIIVTFTVGDNTQIRHVISGSDNAVERAGALALIAAHIALAMKAEPPKGKK